jgi:hypothetical protein
MVDISNMIYGKRLWDQLNASSNPMSAIPKQPYTKSGYRGVAPSSQPTGGIVSGKYIASLGAWGVVEPHFCVTCHELIDANSAMFRFEGTEEVWYCPKCWEEKDMYTSKW